MLSLRQTIKYACLIASMIGSILLVVLPLGDYLMPSWNDGRSFVETRFGGQVVLYLSYSEVPTDEPAGVHSKTVKRAQYLLVPSLNRVDLIQKGSNEIEYSVVDVKLIYIVIYPVMLLFLFLIGIRMKA